MALNLEITCVKYTLFFFNFIGWIAGAVIFGIGIWIAVDPDLRSYMEQMKFEHYYIGAYLIITAGVITMIVGFLGCCGAINENICMLTTYFIIVFIVFLIELGVVIYMLCVGFQYTSLDSFVKRNMQLMVYNYNLNDAVHWVMDELQRDLKCCGAMGARDYIDINLEVPNSCRDEITGNQFRDNCYQSFIDLVEGKSGLIAGLAFTICAIHIVAMIFSLCLCLALRRENKAYN